VKHARKTNHEDLKPVTLTSIAKEAVILAGLKAHQFATPITIHSNTDSKILCNEIEIEIEIEQVLIILINNAVDATKDIQDRWVKVIIDEVDNHLILKITDAGKNMTQEVAQSIFEPFFTTKKIGEGTGLGLSISKGILENHNSSIHIDLDSENTCFTIKMPIYISKL
jgi:C4-dicarboxylate-specific signal transduction histidine kinase